MVDPVTMFFLHYGSILVILFEVWGPLIGPCVCTFSWLELCSLERGMRFGKRKRERKKSKNKMMNTHMNQVDFVHGTFSFGLPSGNYLLQ